MVIQEPTAFLQCLCSRIDCPAGSRTRGTLPVLREFKLLPFKERWKNSIILIWQQVSMWQLGSAARAASGSPPCTSYICRAGRAAPWPYIAGGGCWDDQLHLTSASSRVSIHTQHLNCSRTLPACQGEKQRQELGLPLARSAAKASRVPDNGARASLISTNMIIFQDDFILLANKLLVK